MRVLLLLLILPALCAAQDYSLNAIDVRGRDISVDPKNTNRATVVCFLGTECPLARLYGPRLSDMAEEFADRGVQFVGVNSNRQDSVEDIRDYADQLRIPFPLVRDENNVIADRFSARRTPEVFVLDANLKLVYRGAVDDQYEPGVSRSKPSRTHLRQALTELLRGEPVSVPQTFAPGCLIGRVRQPEPGASDVTFANHISRILQKHCVECHRPGEIGPFSLTDYDEVAGWGETMVEVIDNGRMPPWHAAPGHGDFANERLMPEREKQMVREWVQAGMPRGDDKDLPERAKYTEGWQLPRDPDDRFPMRERPFVVPADGVVEYQYFVVDPGFTEDKWVTAAQVVPGNRSVVHHAIVFIRPPDGSPFRGVGWLSAYVPGQRVLPLPPGRARKVPAGSRLVFQMHYTPNGKQAADTTEIGLIYGNADEITHEVYSLVGIDQEFEIPPHAGEHKVRAEVPWLPGHAELLAITPHMHYRGKSFRLFTRDEGDRTLLHVPRYDFNWQHTYLLERPLPLKELKKLQFEVTFDNSDENPFNPDPSQWVTWGDQTWEEMAVAFFEIAEPLDKTGEYIGQAKPINPKERERKIEAYVKRVFEKLDVNGDNVIERGETPIVVKFFNFGKLDRNADGVLTREEVRRAGRMLY